MKVPKLALVRMKYLNLVSNCRRFYLEELGLKVQRGGILGKISSDWPHRISIGVNCQIEDGVHFPFTKPFIDANNVMIGNYVFIGRGCEFNIGSGVIIGDDCMIASNTTFVDIGHSTDRNFTMNKQETISAPIIINNDFWTEHDVLFSKG